MKSENRFLTYLKNLQGRWGASYIIRTQFIAQIISSVAVIFGLGYLFLNVEFTKFQTRQLLIIAFILMSIANLSVIVIIYFSSTNTRKRLDSIARHKPESLDDPELEIKAWREIVTLVQHFGVSASVAGLFLVVLPLTVYMYVIVGIAISQAIHVALSGLLSVIAAITLNILLLGFFMIPPKLLLVPKSVDLQLEGLTTQRLQSRLQLFVVTLIAIALLMVSPRAYQEAVNAMGVSGLVSRELSTLQIQLIIVAILALFIGAIFTYLMSQTLDLPLQNLMESITLVQQGNLSQRASVMGTDEIGKLSIYFNKMLDQLQELQTDLENQVANRTSDLMQKTNQLQIASQIARQATSIQNVKELLDTISNSISEKFGYYHTGLFLVDDVGENAVLQAASSPGGQRMLARGHRLRIGSQSIVGTVARQRRPHIALDVGTDAIHFNNPDLPDTRSEMALPLLVRDQVIGVLDIQSKKSAAFSQENLEIMESLADQIALAIENARLISESQTIIHQLQRLSSEKSRSAWEERSQRQSYAYTFTPRGIEAGVKSESEKGNKYKYLEIPIESRGQRIGKLKLARQEESTQQWTERDKSVIEEIVSQIGLALEGARLMEDSLWQAQREKTVSEIGSKIRETLDIDTVLKTAVQELQQIFGLEEAEVRLGIPESDGQNNSNGSKPSSASENPG